MSLQVSHLHKKYGTKVVVEDLSFSMEDTGVYALLGTNGAGKTTSIRMMLGMLAKDGGEVLWNGKPLTTDSCNIGYLAEERGLYPKYGLMDQLLYFASLRGVGRDEAKKRIRSLAERLEVEEYLYPNQPAAIPEAGGRAVPALGRKREKPKLADQLSKGNQQKIQFMASLLSDPELIILDEPLSGLDPVNTDLIRDVIREEIAKGKYLIMSSHQMPTVEEFCTEITILDRSKTILQGNLNEIKKSRGRVNLHLKCEGDAADCIRASGAEILSEKEWEYQIKVKGEAQANALLSSLIGAGIPVVTFDLREPSLHEIFVEKVGEANDADET
ncbi:MAG: ATP-binding cassette domain-containing protein [Clostridia bacterium]|nr:ATP-binding cassette domain-containing protein [Clostridia bacterium]